MSRLRVPLSVRISLTLKAVAHVLRRPAYALLAIASTLLMAGIVIWSLNLDLLVFIFFDAPLTLFEKLEFVSYGYKNLFTTFSSLLSVAIVTFTVLFGINIALLVFAIRRAGIQSIPKKSGGSAFLFALLGGGCVACGTSLFAPLLISFGVVGAPLLRDLGVVFNLIGSVLLLYSIYKVSLVIQNLRATSA